MENRKKRALVVDDDQNLIEIIKEALEESGEFHVWTESKSSRAALAASIFQPDVVVLDVIMPHPDGGEVAAEIRQNVDLQNVPVIFFTALADEGETETAGGDRILSKTATISDLIDCVEEALAQTRPLLQAAA